MVVRVLAMAHVVVHQAFLDQIVNASNAPPTVPIPPTPRVATVLATVFVNQGITVKTVNFVTAPSHASMAGHAPAMAPVRAHPDLTAQRAVTNNARNPVYTEPVIVALGHATAMMDIR